MIYVLVILGLVLRLINIIKPEGLWNDEYVSWFIASTPFKEGFWHEVLKQCHMPFYYLYLKSFARCSDLILRLASVIPSILAIPVMYLIGKEVSKKTGYVCAGLTTILPFLVYYAQEVRFYSILFLFSALSLLFVIKLVKGKTAWLGYIISSALILLTHVLGGIYVILTLFYILYKRKNISLKIIFGIFLGILLTLPFGINILKMIPSSQWWGSFSYTNILFLFSDYFSPILTNNINAPQVFFYNKDLLFLILLPLPTLIAVFVIMKGVKHAKGLSLIVLGTVFVTAVLALSGKIVFITKYTMEIFPILILLFALGIKGKLGNILLSVFVTVHLFAIFTPYYPAKIFRTEGHKLVADVLNTKNPDKILFTYYEPNRFLRYLKTDAEMNSINKTVRFRYLEHPKEMLSNINKNERVSIVFLDSVSFIPPESIEVAKQNNLPEMFVTFSSIKALLIKILNDNYTDFDVQKKGSWTVITATKLK